MKWTEEQTVNFVREYVKYECLYNVNSNEYRIKPFRDAALLELSSSMCIKDFGPKEAYQKIRSLKSTYSQELKKVRDSKRSGAGRSDIYIPNVKWYSTLNDALLAVNSTGECRETQSNFETVSPPEVQQIENDLQHDNDTRSNEEYTSSDAVSQRKDGNRKINKDKDLKNKTRKRSLQDYEHLLTIVKNVAEAVKKPVEQIENEFDIFGKSVAAQLKTMPLDVAIEMQTVIQNDLSNARLKILRDTQCFSSHSNYSMTQISPTYYGHDSESSQKITSDPINIKLPLSPETAETS